MARLAHQGHLLISETSRLHDIIPDAEANNFAR